MLSMYAKTDIRSEVMDELKDKLVPDEIQHMTPLVSQKSQTGVEERMIQ